MTKKITEYVIYISFWIMIFYDILAALSGYPTTITAYIREMSHYPIVSFAFGAFVGTILERARYVKSINN